MKNTPKDFYDDEDLDDDFDDDFDDDDFDDDDLDDDFDDDDLDDDFDDDDLDDDFDDDDLDDDDLDDDDALDGDDSGDKYTDINYLDRDNDKEGLDLGCLGYLLIAIGVIWVLICSFITSEFPDLGMPLLFVGLIVMLLGCVCASITEIRFRMQAIKQEKQQEEEEIRRKEEEIRRKEGERRQWETLVRSGQWEFPVEEFYEVCEKENLTSLDNAIFLKKAMAYAEDFLNNDLLRRYKNLYLDETKVKEYFAQGRAAKDNAYITPQDGKLDKVKRSNYKLFESFVKHEGFEKRSAWLSKEIYKLQTRINEIERGQEALHTLALATLESAYKKPTTDWATMGGIASGLAGPAAGLAVASDIMAENAKIEAENAVNQAYANNLATDFIKKSIEISPYDLKKQKEIFEKEKADIRYKVVLDGIDKDELFESLKITSICFESDKSTEIIVTFTNSYIPDVPQTVKMVTDGTLNAKIFCDNILVDEVCVPLPMFGVRCKNEEKIEMTVYSPKYMLGTSRNYRVEFTPNNLYVIER